MSSIDPTADIHARIAAAEAALRAVGQQHSPALRHVDIAVLISCHNDASSVGEVVKSFRVALPNARIYVYDNNSYDNTAAVAREAGAIVRREPLQGKAHVVGRMFSDIEADVYVMVDGDGTYDAAAAPRLVSRLIEAQADLVVGARITQEKEAYKARHRFGAFMLAELTTWIYGDQFVDMMSGYRAVSRRFAKSYPAVVSRFGTEAELTLHALDLGMITAEVQTAYRPQAPTSGHRFAIVGEVIRGLAAIGRMIRDQRPMAFFTSIAGILMAAAVCTLLAAQDAATQLPLAFLSFALAVMSAISLVSGLALRALALGRREMKRLAYKQVESLTARLERFEETRLTLTSLRAQALAENPPMPVYGAAKQRRAH